MKKNTKVAIEEKFETAGKNNKDTTRLLTGNVRMLVHNLEQVTPAVGRKLVSVKYSPPAIEADPLP